MVALEGYTAMAAGTAEGLRAYLTTLRRLRGYSQEDLAAAMKFTGNKSVYNWESGKTDMISVESALHAVRFLGGSFADLERFATDTVTDEEGRYLALERIAAPLSDAARQQTANVLYLLADEIRSGRLPENEILVKAQRMLLLLPGLSPEEHRIIATIFRWLADETQQTGLFDRLLRRIGQLFGSRPAAAQP